MVARRQLTAIGVDWDHVDDQVRGGRWVVRTPRVVSTTTEPLGLDQRRWLAVLHAGSRSMLGSLSAAAALGLAGWDRTVVTVWVEDELSFEPVEGCASSAPGVHATCWNVPATAYPLHAWSRQSCSGRRSTPTTVRPTGCWLRRSSSG